MNDEHRGDPAGASPIADRLAGLKAQILAAWEQRVREEVPAAGDARPRVLRNSLPQFLDNIVSTLRDGNPYTDACMDEVCRIHGEQRASLPRYTLDQVVSEYRILRESMFRMLEGAGGVPAVERGLIHRSIDFGITDAVSQFAIEQASVEQKINEEALHVAARLHALIHSSPSGLGFLDSGLRYVHVNEPLARLNGVPAAEHIGRTVREVLPADHAQVEPLLNEVVRSGEPIENLEVAIQPPGDPGHLHHLLASYFPVKGPDGRVLGIGASIVDITDMKEAEKRIAASEAQVRTFVEAMPQITFIADADGSITSYNRRHYEYFGVQPGETEAWKWKEKPLHHPDDLQRTIETWNRSVQTGEPYQIEYRLRRHDGTYRWHLGRAVPLRDGSGRITSWLGTNTDIHEQKLLQQALSKAIDSLQAERDMRERIVSTLSHDLRTPLAAAKMAAHLIGRRGGIPEETLGLSSRIVENMSRADRMIHDLLDVQRIRAGKSMELDIEPLNMGEVVRATVENLTTIHGDRFRLQTEGHLDGYWSREDMGRVVENLCSNAVKYGDAHAPVTVAVTECEGQVRIAVHNVGKPLADEDRTRLFGQFERLDSAKMSHTEGWGIGLTIVKGVAEAHGGAASARAVQDGTEFLVQVPRDARPFQRCW